MRRSSWRLFFLLLVVGYCGTIALGFIGGVLLGRLAVLASVFLAPVFFWFSVDQSKWRSFLLFFLLLYTQFAVWTGVNNAPLGAPAREKAADLIAASSQNPAEGKRVSEEISSLLQGDSNWFFPDSFEYRALEKARDASLASYNSYVAEIKRQREAAEAEAARVRREQEIADGSYMPSEFEVGRPCKELAKSNSLTRRIDWGFFGLANSKWFPAQKTIILEGRSKNAFGVDIPFSIECRWEKGGVVRLVEIT